LRRFEASSELLYANLPFWRALLVYDSMCAYCWWLHVYIKTYPFTCLPMMYAHAHIYNFGRYTNKFTYAYAYTYTYTYIFLHIHLHLHTLVRIHVYIHVYTCICTCICIYMCTYIYIYIYIHIHVCMHACMYVCTYVRMYVCISDSLSTQRDRFGCLQTCPHRRCQGVVV
jgi:hypothetical protein